MKHLWMVIPIAGILLLGAKPGYGQERMEAGAIAAEMALVNTYEKSYTIGFAGAPSRQYQLYKQLLSVATTDELAGLASDHFNPVVRLYAYQALKRKRADIPRSLQEKMEKDGTLVTVILGCLAEDKPVRSLLKEPVFLLMEK